LRTAGVPLARAPAAAVLMHGRDQDAAFMLDVAERAALGDLGILLPESEQRSWYPGRFFDAVETNEPHLTRAVEAFEEAMDTAADAGLPASRLLLAGFSQGACVLTELLRRRPRPLGAAAILTGALMGPPAPAQRALPPPAGDLAGLRLHVSGSRHDAWIPVERQQAASRYFERAGARVTTALSDEVEHHVSDAEAACLRELADEFLSEN
jgi:phospholipase/carboxylesterase